MSPASQSANLVSVIEDVEFAATLSSQLGSLSSELLLVPRNGADVAALPFDWTKAKAYYGEYCPLGGGNDCPDGQFDNDCTHFVAHGLSKSSIIVNLPSVTCYNGVCIRVAELAAAFKNAAAKYTNVKKIGDISKTREGDFCFVVSWFGLATDHAMVLADIMGPNGGKVYGHTNPRCGQQVDLTGQTLVIYRIE
ncbi:hypothetical protein [Cupriavidus oxalaticus]|uniref:Uncharacterized protein n=1 Tax=Cupriavidus oxalaticus TaxID=96344 RepID=A0A4P7LKU1_9BURK|nr:hypothetical protein [Cupriavidus oxalaticus]QBY56455.1 hypothetical protein E0W60_36335 [Cupriavidus oxalaticus]